MDSGYEIPPEPDPIETIRINQRLTGRPGRQRSFSPEDPERVFGLYQPSDHDDLDTDPQDLYYDS